LSVPMPGTPSRTILLNILMAVISIGITLYAAEGLLAFLASRAGQGCPQLHIEEDKCIAARRAGLPFDSRSRVEVIRALETPTDSVWPNFNSWELNLRGDTLLLGGQPVQPLGGISLVRTLYCNERGSYELFTSDEYGFRNPPGLYQAPADLALIGDSFVQGYCVPDDSAAASLLRRRWPRTLNFGRDNHGPLSQLAVLREYAAAHRPETVLWFYYEGNDLGDLEIEKGRETLLRYLDRNYSAGLMAGRDSLDRQLKSIVLVKRQAAEQTSARKRNRAGPTAGQKLMRFATLSNIRQLITRARAPRAGETPMDEAMFRRVLGQARDETLEWNGRFVLVYLPAWERFGRSSQANPHRDRVLAVAQTLAIPVIDLTEAFTRHPDPVSLFPFRMSGHYTPEGQRLIADLIIRAAGDSVPAPYPARAEAIGPVPAP
jgi:hypothetical protein